HTGRFGAEYVMSDGFVVRGGLYDTHYTGGFSLEMPAVGVDYGFVANSEDSNETVQMLGFRFGMGPRNTNRKQRYALFKQKSYAHFRLDGSIVSGKSEISLLGGQRIGTNDLITLIHEAGEDPSVEGFIVRVGQMGSSLGSIALIQDIRHELKKSQSQGKKVIVYLESWTTLPEYYLASIADQIVMPELASISHLGLEMEISKTHDFLKNFGFGRDVITSGKYKGALNPASGKLTMNDQVVLEDMMHSLYQQVLVDIRKDRDLNWEDVKTVFDGRIVSATKAKSLGLIDDIGYWDSIKEDLKKTLGEEDEEIRMESIVTFMPESDVRPIFGSFKKIAVVEIDGAIGLGRNTSGLLYGGKSTGADEFDAMVTHIKKDYSIKGVLLRINSPGGSILASDQIYSAIGRLKESGMPVYVSMGNMAASGGYYVSMSADKIYANPGTLTGSIGVITEVGNRESFNKMLGIETQTLKTGKYMDMLSSKKTLTSEEKEMIQTHQKQQYEVFVNKVMSDRDISKSEAEDVAQGQVFTGEQAKSLKLVDQLGNFYDAVDGLSEEVGVTDPELVFYRAKPQMTLPRINLNLLQLFTGFMGDVVSPQALGNFDFGNALN
ncbi:signal peptide peptidase SppA, partial [bacterium]|nr:signal peptide peptidase SppA [bacterium]